MNLPAFRAFLSWFTAESRDPHFRNNLYKRTETQPWNAVPDFSTKSTVLMILESDD